MPPVLQTLSQKSGREVEDARPPVRLVAQPLLQAVLERRQPQHEVLALMEFRRAPVQARTRLDEFPRIERLPALVALIAPSGVERAVRTPPGDVPVRQVPTGDRAVRQVAGRRVQVVLLKEPPEERLRPLPVVVGARGRVQVERDPERVPGLHEPGVVFVDNLLGRLPIPVSPQHDRRPVLVAAGDHEHTVSQRPVKPREDVRRQVRPGNLPEVQRTVRVGPRHADEDALSHALTLARGLSGPPCGAKAGQTLPLCGRSTRTEPTG